MSRGSSRVVWDGSRLETTFGAEGRRFRADPRCFAEVPVTGAWAHVCAATADDGVRTADVDVTGVIEDDAIDPVKLALAAS